MGVIVIREDERAPEGDEAVAEEEGSVVEAVTEEGTAVEASVEVTEVAAEATAAEMPPAKVARAAAEVSAPTEVSAATEVPAATEVSAATDVPTTAAVPAVAHTDRVRNAAGERERQEGREAKSRGGGQRSANRRELHEASLVAA